MKQKVFRNIFLVTLLFGPKTIMAQTYFNETEVRTEIIIHASSDSIWKLLTNFNEYTRWHPYIKEVKGQFKKKKRITVTALNEDSTTTKFSAYILELKPNEVLSWGGSLGFFFRARHYFILTPINSDSVQFVQGEYWHGIFGKWYGNKIYQVVYNKFILMNRRMKDILEKGNQL